MLKSWHVVERLRDRARERGIYTPHLPEEWGGLGIGVLGMALISQECGVSGLASLGLNAMAPDEGNMHTLLIAGNEEQLETLPAPARRGPHALVLRDDRARRGVARDPTNLETTAVRDGDEWVLNGRKWCITGAERRGVRDRRREDRHRRGRRATATTRSSSSRPTRPGWKIARHPEWMGSHSPGGHPEIDARRTSASRSATCSATRARASSSRRSAWPAAAWRTRCAGSASSQRALDLSVAAAARAQGVRQGARAPPGRCSS